MFQFYQHCKSGEQNLGEDRRFLIMTRNLNVLKPPLSRKSYCSCSLHCDGWKAIDYKPKAQDYHHNPVNKWLTARIPKNISNKRTSDYMGSDTGIVFICLKVFFHLSSHIVEITRNSKQFSFPSHYAVKLLSLIERFRMSTLRWNKSSYSVIVRISNILE